MNDMNIDSDNADVTDTGTAPEKPIPPMLKASGLFSAILGSMGAIASYYTGNADLSKEQRHEKEYLWKTREAETKQAQERAETLEDERRDMIEFRAYTVEHNNKFEAHCDRMYELHIEQHQEFMTVVKQGFADIIQAIKPQ